MKNLFKPAISLLLLSMITTPLFAQISASDQVQVLISLKKGLQVSHTAGDLDFGEVLLDGSEQTPSVTEQNGAVFQITGHPNRSVDVSFSSVTLDNDVWAADVGSENTGTMEFVPSVDQTGTSSLYAGATDFTAGSTTLPNLTGTGTLYLWVGGSITVAADQAHGEYTGNFVLTVTYN